ncbi:MAG: cell division protein FtsL [Luminiphilus sp.]|jgi:cell division protein FtsL|nr:cell division protein FtsL [Luminiphilus sp.]
MAAARVSSLAIVLLTVASLLTSSLALIASTHSVREDYAQLQSLELERWRLQEDYTRLLLEMNTWAAPHRIEQLASERLSMQPPDLSLSQVVTE